MKNKNEITVAIEALEKIYFSDKECSIMAADAYEESVFIGTKDSLVFLALQILEIVNASNSKQNTNIDIDEDLIDDETFEYTNEIKYCFDELADVWPVCLYLAKNKEGLQKLKKYFSSK
jgi:hypothetical protein